MTKYGSGYGSALNPYKKEIIAHLQNGKTQAEVADLYGKDTSTVSRWVQDNVPEHVAQKPRNILDRHKQAIQTMIDKGASGTAIAEKYGVSDDSVHRWLKRQGWTIKQSKLDPHREDIIKRLQAGETSTSIAKRYGITIDGLYKWKKRRGIQLTRNMVVKKKAIPATLSK